MFFRPTQFLAILSCFFLISCSGEPEQAPITKQTPLTVETITINKEKTPIWIEYTSKTVATQRIAVQARVSGRLEAVLFQEGDLVKKGDILFVIEKTSYQAAVEQAKAALQKDLATLKLAVADVNRYRPLVADGLAPRATLEQYQARQGELSAIINADQAAVRDAELTLSYTDVLAPADGRASLSLVNVGNIVGYGTNTTLTTIVSDNPMYTYFNPTEADFQLMRKFRTNDRMGARVRIPFSYTANTDQPIAGGYVDFADNKIDPATGTISMRAIIDNQNHYLLEGTFVYTEVFLTDQLPFFALPMGIIFDDQQGAYVYVVDENGTVKRKNVTRGYSTRYLVTIKEGLEAGDQVIISGLVKLREGLEVAPTDMTSSKSVHATLKEKGLLKGAPTSLETTTKSITQ